MTAEKTSHRDTKHQLGVLRFEDLWNVILHVWIVFSKKQFCYMLTYIFKDLFVVSVSPPPSSSSYYPQDSTRTNALLFELAPLLLNNLKWLLYLNPCLGAIHSYPLRWPYLGWSCLTLVKYVRRKSQNRLSCSWKTLQSYSLPFVCLYTHIYSLVGCSWVYQ